MKRDTIKVPKKSPPQKNATDHISEKKYLNQYHNCCLPCQIEMNNLMIAMFPKKDFVVCGN